MAHATDCSSCCVEMCSMPSVYSHLGLHNILKQNVRSSEACFSATFRVLCIVDHLNDIVKCIFVQIVVCQHKYFTSTLKNKGVLIILIPELCFRERPRKQKH